MRARRALEAARAAQTSAVVVGLLALLAASAAPAAGAVVTLAADRDNTLFQDATGSLSNGAGPVFFAGRNGQNLARRALVRFDVAAIPPGAVISGAALTLHVSNVSDVTFRTFTLHRVQRDWGEGTSSGTGGNGAPATDGDATWLHAVHPDVSWTSAGGDFEPIVSASQAVNDVGFYTWSTPAMVADLQAWLQEPSANFGWALIGDESLAGTARRFDSRENSDAAVRPALEVTWSVPAAVTTRGEGGVALAPCEPNPVTGRVRFSFSLSERARTQLVITDVMGRRLATVVDGVFDAGRHDARWERGGLPAGVYFYRVIVSGRMRASRRFVVVL